MTSTAGLVLAAGAGTRFGQPKAPVVVRGERLVDYAVRCLSEAGCSPIVVVLGAWLGEVPGAEVVVNEEWDEGIGSSLRVGLDAVSIMEACDSVLITLVDLPGQTAEAARRVLAGEADIVVATYGSVRGHPVRIARQYWSAVRECATGDVGARGFLRGRSDIDLVEVADVADGSDLDYPINPIV